MGAPILTLLKSRVVFGVTGFVLRVASPSLLRCLLDKLSQVVLLRLVSLLDFTFKPLVPCKAVGLLGLCQWPATLHS